MLSTLFVIIIRMKKTAWEKYQEELNRNAVEKAKKHARDYEMLLKEGFATEEAKIVADLHLGKERLQKTIARFRQVKRVIALYLEEGKSLKEIGAIEGIAHESVRKILMALENKQGKKIVKRPGRRKKTRR